MGLVKGQYFPGEKRIFPSNFKTDGKSKRYVSKRFSITSLRGLVNNHSCPERCQSYQKIPKPQGILLGTFALRVANLLIPLSWTTVLPGLCRLRAGMSCWSLSFCCSSSSRSSLQEGKNEHILLVTYIWIAAWESMLWLAIFEQKKGYWKKNKPSLLPPATFTYSPGPDCGNGITLLVLPIFTVPAIWAIRSCHLQ